MPSFGLGEMIKRLRKQKGISQEELAYPIIDRTTLSKIESGKVTPHMRTLEFLLNKLGYDSNEFVSHFLAPEDFEAQSAVDELANLLKTVMRKSKTDTTLAMCARVEELINQLENNHEFLSRPLNMQILLDAKARHAYNLKQDDEALALAKQALEIVIPNFNERDIPSYHLNKRCNNMISLISMIYAAAQKYDDSINVLYALKENVSNTYHDIVTRAKSSIAIYSNLAMILLQAGRPKEAYDVCEEGIHLCAESNDYMFFTSLSWFQAKALLALGNKDEFITMSRKLYCAYDIYRQKWTMNHVRETVLEATGVDLADTQM